MSFRTIVEEIMSSHHSLLRRELPKITDLMNLLSSEYPDNEPLTEARQIYSKVRSKVETHLKDEETVLFPTGISLEAGGELIPPEFDLLERLAEMEKEHDGCGKALSGIQQTISCSLQPCELRDRVLASIKLVQTDFVAHVEKENSKVHPMFLELFQSRAAHRSNSLN